MTIDPGMFAKHAGLRDFAVPGAFLAGALTLPPSVYFPASLGYDLHRLSKPDRNILDLLGAGLSGYGTYRAWGGGQDPQAPINTRARIR
jgi:hypothetical protein